MTREELLAAAIKVLGTLPVLRWPLVGILGSMIADALDVVVMNFVDLGGGGIRDYHVFDKLSDLPPSCLLLVATRGWTPFDRRLAVALFGYRALGVALFELAGFRIALFAFPNLFETWFLFVCLRDRFLADGGQGARAVLLGVLVVVKGVQEYLLHIARFFDRFVLADLVRAWWGR